jgi:hypothetical protein
MSRADIESAKKLLKELYEEPDLIYDAIEDNIQNNQLHIYRIAAEEELKDAIDNKNKRDNNENEIYIVFYDKLANLIMKRQREVDRLKPQESSPPPIERRSRPSTRRHSSPSPQRIFRSIAVDHRNPSRSRSSSLIRTPVRRHSPSRSRSPVRRHSPSRSRSPVRRHRTVRSQSGSPLVTRRNNHSQRGGKKTHKKHKRSKS